MTETAEKAVLVSTDERGVMTIQLNRPHRLNAVVLESVATVRKALEDAQADDAVRAIVLTGDDRSFSSGADLQAKAEAKAEGESSGSLLDDVNEIIMLLKDSSVPTVAAVSGAAAGVGCSLALATDYVVMSPTSFFMLAFTKIGLMPDGGASALVAASAGRHRAMRMALTAERVYGEKALEWGLASELVEDSSPLERAQEVAATFAAGAPRSMAATRQAINEIALPTLRSDLNREVVGQSHLLGTEDAQEGANAFREKRAPQYTGR
ncbi:enoyl-CoA hydratase-related protein [Brevibacterium jeotgali]|uniref:Short chain enoyl-CoA hydratase/Enoyl-CoA hydratase n=1 Tax=Brevibacterium jeotgali TaxID=1262550 RepID=A0A2H1L3Z2_9MICO|nr:enoyl-CoA hydratase-related protein [Brevibacterium jeotgali]TWB98788.1 enoyl-CoA hydratase [Brevibacterium jeotgali]SMY11612.1 short chain enoyl-CoA hydratase/Enoyl-CoA hydratase [Brevibacterium jeotgali]